MKYTEGMGPVSARVIVLEDHRQLAESIKKILLDDKLECEIFRDDSKFIEKVAEDNFDVASIDCDIEGVNKGLYVVEKLNATDQDMAQLVFSIKDEMQDTLLNKGVDVYLSKTKENLTNLNKYKDNIKLLCKLGLARRIVSYLKKKQIPKSEKLPDLKYKQELDNIAERTIFEMSRTYALKQKIAGYEADELIDLLRRRGWWTMFNEVEYSRASWLDKLKKLLIFAELNNSEISTILGIEEPLIEELLNGHIDPESGFFLLERSDVLLSVLAYVLRLSDYEPELMPHYWRVVGLFNGSLSKPPWDELGIAVYLSVNGPIRLSEAHNWIRSH